MKKYLIYLSILFVFIKVNLNAQNNTEKSKKTFTLKWEKVDGAEQYRIQVKNNSGEMLENKVLETNEIELSLKPGIYTIRIGVVNKFGKLSTWSEWENLTIKKKPLSEPIVLGVTLSLGLTYLTPLSGDWSNVYDSTYKAGMIRIGLYFENMNVFQNLFILNNMGIEFDASFAYFEGKYQGGYDTILQTRQFGANLIFRKNFGSLNNFGIIIRAGGGYAISKQDYKEENSVTFIVEKKKITSNDPYYKFGFGGFYSFSNLFYCEAGVDYNTIVYVEPPHFNYIQYYLAFGINL